MESRRVALRDYQHEMKTRLFEAWRTHRSVMIQMPTGTGKTHVLAAVIRELSEADSPASDGRKEEVWIIAHRRELVSQIEATVARYGIGDEPVAVRAMSIQWLSRHWEELAGRPVLIVIDEAHHALAATYMELWRRYPTVRKLGLTATPCRMDRRGFTGLFELLLTSWSIAEFILKGQLSLFDYVSISADSQDQRLIDALGKRGADGDYQVKEMDSVLNHRQSIARLYDSVVRYACGRKGIVYAISIDHARRIAAYYRERGLQAEAIDSRTPSQQRHRLIEAFRSGVLQVLVNVDVFSEGFDCPDVEFVQLARPTLSLAKYLQQVGRGLRRSAGKETCVLIDNVGLYRVFGLPTAAWDWEAMFRGESTGKRMPVASGRRAAPSLSESPEAVEEGGRMQMVVSHEHLQEALTEQLEVPAVREAAAPALTAWQDRTQGLWGLKLGAKKLTEAVYIEEPAIRYGLAAVRGRDRQCAVVDWAGTTVKALGYCRTMRFTRNRFLLSVLHDGRECYTDLLSLRTYDGRPEVKRYGGIELLKQGHVIYSRTRRVYENALHVARYRIFSHGFYLTIADPRAPVAVRPTTDYPCTMQGGYACLLDGDSESYYWMFRRLEDGSIIVADAAGRYYHVEEGREKTYLGGSGVAGPDDDCRTRIEELIRQTKEKGLRQEAAKAEKRRQLFAAISDAIPFRSGMKWGLKVGGRVIVPPIYRNLRPPVGQYCAVEESYSRWGIIALDGKVIVEPKYPEVAIADNGTAVLTSVTGKCISVKL